MMTMHDHLYEDGELTTDAKIWFMDVCDGHLALLAEQQDDFFHLLELKGRGEFYSDEFEAFLLEFPRVQMRFHEMAASL